MCVFLAVFLVLLKQTVVKKASLNGDSKPDLLDV